MFISPFILAFSAIANRSDELEFDVKRLPLQNYIKMEKWAGKTAVVTGASAGIGADIALALSNAGVNVVAAARRLDKLQELRSKCKGRGRIIPCQCDMTKTEDIKKMIKLAQENGGVDIIVNNAAILHYGTVTDVKGDGVSIEDMSQCMNTNVMGVVTATRLAVADMTARKVHGHVIIINSIAGHRGVVLDGCPFKSGLYGASKYAITQIVELIRLELGYAGTKIRVTSISPGAVDTPMVRTSVPENFLDLPMLSGADVANAALYALSAPEKVNISEITIQAVGELM